MSIHTKCIADRKGSNTTIFLGVLAVSAFLMAPFTWSYIASMGGMLIRPVDLIILLVTSSVFISGRVVRFPLAVPVLLMGVVALLLFRWMVHNDGASFISAVKIIYYLTAALALATIIHRLLYAQLGNAATYALVLASPVFVFFIYEVVQAFTEIQGILGARPHSSIIFSTWHRVFSENLFGSEDSLLVQGVSFRNSAGIAFLVASLIFYVAKDKFCDVIAMVLFAMAALFFSRSVWFFQFAFMIFIFLGSGRRGLGIFIFTLIFFAFFLSFVPTLADEIWSRLNSNFGRAEIYSSGLFLLGDSWSLGRADGAVILLGADERVMHNVPLALGLKVGLLGLLFSIVIQFIFLFSLMRNLITFNFHAGTSQRTKIVLIVVSGILFSRPMVSASHELYFSIGEWLALSLFLALSAKSVQSARWKGDRTPIN